MRPTQSVDSACDDDDDDDDDVHEEEDDQHYTITDPWRDEERQKRRRVRILPPRPARLNRLFWYYYVTLNFELPVLTHVLLSTVLLLTYTYCNTSTTVRRYSIIRSIRRYQYKYILVWYRHVGLWQEGFGYFYVVVRTTSSIFVTTGDSISCALSLAKTLTRLGRPPLHSNSTPVSTSPKSPKTPPKIIISHQLHIHHKKWMMGFF